MVIVETSVFTRRILRLLSDDDYRLLQADLLSNPRLGATIRGTGGLRKVRWNSRGRGKRGGVRVIYFWVVSRQMLLMLLVYGKNEQDDLTAEQRRILRRVVEEELSDG